MEIRMDIIECIEFEESYEKWLEEVRERFFEDEELSHMEQEFRF